MITEIIVCLFLVWINPPRALNLSLRTKPYDYMFFLLFLS